MFKFQIGAFEDMNRDTTETYVEKEIEEFNDKLTRDQLKKLEELEKKMYEEEKKWREENEKVKVEEKQEYECSLSKESYIDIGKRIGELVEKKQIAYGNSFGKAHKVLEILYPNGVAVSQYKYMLCIIRIIDKLFRVSNQKKAFGENPFEDIVGYGLLGTRL